MSKLSSKTGVRIRRWQPETYRAIVEDLKSDTPMREIAQKHGVAVNTVRGIRCKVSGKKLRLEQVMDYSPR